MSDQFLAPPMLISHIWLAADQLLWQRVKTRILLFSTANRVDSAEIIT
jgi:hypothetical protein